MRRVDPHTNYGTTKTKNFSHPTVFHHLRTATLYNLIFSTHWMASPSPSLDTSKYHCAVVLFRGRPHPTRVATSVILWDRDANHQTAYSCNTWSVNLSVFLTRAPVPFAEMISYKRSFRSDSATIIYFFMFLIISAEKSTTVFFLSFSSLLRGCSAVLV